jgi:hypothetical protein
MRFPLAIVALLSLVAGCAGQNSMIDSDAKGILEGISPEAWSRLTSKRIYFGHQSVGYNIMEGVTELGRLEASRAIRVVETNDPSAMTSAGFAHSANGVNKRPDTKIAGFDTLLEGGLGDKVDIAFFKFCYVDVTRETDVKRLMSDYAGLMSRMKDRYPKTRFVHVTVPLTIVESGPKAWAKQVLGRPLSGAADNVSRQMFNDMLRATYGSKEPLFDLANWESSLPNGKLETFKVGGVSYPRLATAYSDGGSHLNEHGRVWVAAHLLKFLADLN